MSMSNKEILEKLTLGKDAIETVTVNGIDIQLRPLTSGELSKLESIEKQGFTVTVGVNGQGKKQNVRTNDVDVNAGEFSEYKNEVMYKAVAWSMNIDEKNVKDFQVGVPEQIFEHVIRISKLDDSDLTVVKKFRKE